MVESRRVPGKDRIRANTEKGSNQCEYRKMVNPGEYREKVESVRVSKKCMGEHEKRV